jgi:hypothetical protein
MVKKRKKTNRRTKILLVVLYATFFYFMYYMSVNRSGTGTYDFISSLYVYFSGAVAHMSTRLSNFDFEWTYGLTLISGLLRPLMLVVKYLLGTWPNIYQNTIDIGVKLQFPVSINSLKDFNAFVLPFFYFYCDGGILMVLFDSLVYGAVCESFYLNFKHKKTEFSTVLYLLIISGLMCSMVRYNFILVYYTLAFFVVWFIYKKKKS